MRKQLFIEILKLTELMQAAATQCDWTEVVNLENKRKNFLHQFFEVAAQQQESKWIREGIDRILSIDIFIADQAKREQSSLSQQMQLVSNRKKVSNAYKNYLK